MPPSLLCHHHPFHAFFVGVLRLGCSSRRRRAFLVAGGTPCVPSPASPVSFSFARGRRFSVQCLSMGRRGSFPIFDCPFHAFFVGGRLAAWIEYAIRFSRRTRVCALSQMFPRPHQSCFFFHTFFHIFLRRCWTASYIVLMCRRVFLVPDPAWVCVPSQSSPPTFSVGVERGGSIQPTAPCLPRRRRVVKAPSASSLLLDQFTTVSSDRPAVSYSLRFFL
ncbi:hypothetical protein C8R46DRAFT_1103857 [Mycena filopes]|nr:hypothetical protein C8R46DRAFT_1103857 [Mycena filopes]